jgi:hypothetical protein
MSRTIFWNLKNIQKFWDSNILIRIKDRACVKIIGHDAHKMEGFKLYYLQLLVDL